MNVLDSISRLVRAYPQRPALILGGNALTYRQLWHNATRAAYHLQAQGVGRGDCVAVGRINPQAHLVIVIALARLGAVSTLVQSGWSDEKRTQVFQRNGVSAHVHGDEGARPLAGLTALRAIAAKSLFAPVAEGAAMPRLAQDLDEQPWRIGLSSGTTGESKSIPWTHAQVARLHRVSLDVYPAGPGERLLVFADLGIGLGLGHAMMQLAGGGTVILSDSIRPADFFDIAASERATQALTTTAIAFTLLQHAKGGPPTKLPGLRSLLIGGSAVPLALRQGLQELVCPNLMVTYGSTETGTLARSDLHSFLAHPDSAGRLMPWVQGEAVDEEGRTLAPGEVGQLRFKSPAMASAYVGDPASSAQSFRDGWYYPGDVGAVDADGNLLLGGRKDDLINLQGVKINPAQVEEVLCAHPQVAEAALVAVTGRSGRKMLAAAVVGREGLDSRQLRPLVTEKLGRFAAPGIVLQLKALPRNDAGKVVRSELVAIFERAMAESPAGEERDDTHE